VPAAYQPPGNSLAHRAEARNRQRTRSGRPATRPSRPLPQDGGAGLPPIAEEPPVAFEDDDDAMSSASAAFGRAEAPREREHANIGSRTIGFLQGSWAELRRVQWPDRQQVAQATGVVLGFVVITGIFLGLADYVAGKLINAIL